MIGVRALLAGLTALGLAAEALAEDPTGRWGFRTDIKTKGCTITGEMTIAAPEAGKTVNTCHFISREVCGEGDTTPVEMEQSCRIVTQGEFLLIRSKVERSLTEDVSIGWYLPDHFTVRPTGPGEMTGTWYDQNYRDQVRFWRLQDPSIS